MVSPYFLWAVSVGFAPKPRRWSFRFQWRISVLGRSLFLHCSSVTSAAFGLDPMRPGWMCHKVNLPSCEARRPLCHKGYLPSCVARPPTEGEARRPHLIMTCDIFGTGKTNTLTLCYLLGKTYKPAHSSATLESLKSTRSTKLLEKLLTWAAHTFHWRLWQG